jgi:NAD(P)-dependent dehydrogenase (short-subunit alcohol dehydrogenase family)
VTWQPGPATSVFAAGLFEDSVAVITGGGTGLGREVAHSLARLGGHVVIAGRTASMQTNWVSFFPEEAM